MLELRHYFDRRRTTRETAMVIAVVAMVAELGYRGVGVIYSPPDRMFQADGIEKAGEKRLSWISNTE